MDNLNVEENERSKMMLKLRDELSQIEEERVNGTNGLSITGVKPLVLTIGI